MATLRPQLSCALCGNAIDAFGSFFRTSGAFLRSRDPLLPYCDAPLHWSCYATWRHRGQFARQYVDAWAQANRRNPFWWSVYRDERVYVSVNPSPPIEEASVRLCEVGSDIRVPLAKWKAWLAEFEGVTPGLDALEKDHLREALPLLRMRLPDDHAVVNAIDPGEKRGARARAGSCASPS